MDGGCSAEERREYAKQAFQRRGLQAPAEEEMYDVEKRQPPRFMTPLQDIYLSEFDAAHFECTVVPIGDPNMRIEWYYNGQLLKSGEIASPRLTELELTASAFRFPPELHSTCH